jgi:hypothetical protein
MLEVDSGGEELESKYAELAMRCFGMRWKCEEQNKPF